MTKHFFIISSLFLFLLLTSKSVIAQVGGASGSTLDTYCVDVVDYKKLELEPVLYHFKSKKTWDDNWKLNDFAGSPDSVRLSTGINFRITHGLFDKFEIGTSFSTDLQLASIGFRFVFFDKDKSGLALIGGYNVPMGNKTIDISLRISNTISSIGGGLVYSHYFTENLSIDLNVQYFRFTGKTADNNKGSVYLNGDVGYYLFLHQLQLIGGLGYQFTHFDTIDNHILTFYPGITVETGERYIIVLAAPFDIVDKNADKAFGISPAITITLD